MGNGMNYDLDFEKRIKDMPDRQLLEFVARQTLEVVGRCKEYDTDIALLKSGDRKTAGIVGGITASITSIIIGVINYFISKRG